MDEAVNNCPFCGIFFRSLGHHNYRCKVRGGRDYSQFLKSNKKTDSSCLSKVEQSVSANVSQHFQLSGSTESARPSSSSIPQISTVSPPTLPDSKDCDAWNSANTFFSTYLILHVLLSLKDTITINNDLSSGILNYFTSVCGLNRRQSAKYQGERNTIGKLRMPVKSRNYLRREFRKAIRTQKLLEAIQSLSKSLG